MQDRESISINSRDTSISRSKQLELAIPQSKIASLSSGEFVGMVADNPDQRIELKTFAAEILNDHSAITKEREAYKSYPIASDISPQKILKKFLEIKKDIQIILETEMERMLNTPDLDSLIIQK